MINHLVTLIPCAVAWPETVPGKWDLVAMLMKTDQKLKGTLLPCLQPGDKMALAKVQAEKLHGGSDTINNALETWL